MAGIWTNSGLSLIASAIQSPGINHAITFVGLSPGCGTLASPLTNGQTYTSLPLNAALPAQLAQGQSLTIINGTSSQVVTTSAVVNAGATSIPVSSFVASANYAANTTGVCPTPAVTDLALYNETVRVAANVGVAGSAAGESLNSAYFDPTQPTNIYLMVGYFGGSSATSATGTGTLMIEDVQFWSHTVNAETNTYQADNLI